MTHDRPERSAAGRTIVKVCGLTGAEDAAWALACGADWLGFIVEARGPRRIGAEGMARIVAALPPDAVGVAVLAGVTPAEALDLATAARAKRVQLHETDPAGWPADFPLPCAFVTGVTVEGGIDGTLAPEPHLVHLDTSRGGHTGGTGVTFPWRVAPALLGGRPFMLAGGLGPENVADAIVAARPFGVDASSRLEREPAHKDPERVRAFVAAVRALEVQGG